MIKLLNIYSTSFWKLIQKLFKSKGEAFLLVGKMMMVILMMGGAMESGAQVDGIRPLKIGDTIPEALWNMPLSATNIRSGEKSIKLGDFRNKKLIILDFWATWCSPCIKGMPLLNDIVKSNSNITAISVGTEDRQKIEKFLENQPLTYQTGFELPVLVEDKHLKLFFPHARIPHYVWIDADGKVMAFTSSDALSAENITKALEMGHVKTEMKIDYDKTGPLYVVDNRLPQWGDLQYFSLLSKGYKEGMGSSNRRRVVDGKLVGNLFTNASIYKMYSYLIDQIDPDNFKNEFQFDVRDMEQLMVTPHSGRDIEWKKKYFYSFDYWNLNSAPSNQYLDMIQALNLASPYELIISKKKRSFYVLQDRNKKTNKSADADLDQSDFAFDVKSTPRHLTVYLNNNAHLDLHVINRATTTVLHRYALKNAVGITQINKRLKNYDLQLVKKDMLVNSYLFKEKGGHL